MSEFGKVVYGKAFEGEMVPIKNITGEISSVIVHGKVVSLERRDIKNDKAVLLFVITDYTDSIKAKIFAERDEALSLEKNIKAGTFLKIKGRAVFDSYEKDIMLLSISGMVTIPGDEFIRMDNAPVKRVELHCHTKMSAMDSVCDTEELLKQAERWGHPAIAITDHGVVQGFTEAYHAVCEGKYTGKVIYGMEAYLVDNLTEIAVNSKGQTLTDRFVVFDIETTGLNCEKDKIIEIGAVKVEGGTVTDRFSTFVNPGEHIPKNIQTLTSIDDSMVEPAPGAEEAVSKFMEFAKGCALVAHNAPFDVGFIKKSAADIGIDFDFTYLDTLALARVLLPKLSRFRLDSVAKALSVTLSNHHRAVDDAECTAEIFLKFIEMLDKQGIRDLDGVNKVGILSKDKIKKSPSYHAVILAANEVGRVNLYKLVSKSNLDYFYRKPIIPKSELNAHREGLLLGTACEAGELFRAIYENKSEQEIEDIVRYYDYLEIQPVGNNAFLIGADDDRVTCEEDLREINRTILALGDKYGKPVVATGDVHFLNPKDGICRNIIQAGMGYEDAERQKPLYFHTTEEMLSEFEYLGARAKEVVIDNPNKIADMCELTSPVRADKCPPVIPDADEKLRDMCFKKAHDIYGEKLPAPVQERLETELHSIISNGYAVMYVMAHELVKKSNEDGYMVGSRGSVGSSFVATMSGITEVNPLSPHYYCPNCHYSDFDSDTVKAFAGKAGCDMPDMECPNCHTMMKKNGFNIPFETFLGFKGDKEPDIDLNFSGEYQAKAHKALEQMFGEGHTFKAGTVGTLAEKSAYGFVKHYFEDRGINKRKCELDRLVSGCTGVKRTTGQHPGGIVILPDGEDINTFTPVQYPADDEESSFITTHFDYHSIDHNLMKFDVLGHDDPTMLKVLYEYTGFNPEDVPFNDEKVMSLFRGTEALGITPEQIGGTPVGSLGIPEFGTDFVIGMLMDAKPECFTDLVRISGLGHGTDVWLGNAQTLIKEGNATISTVISTRDDIMTYLISKGIEPATSFSIMENVRKGKVASGKCDKWPEWKEEMLSKGVPDWYVQSCEKIRYMFPKAHAAAYVMMAWRIAYYKVYYPQAFYATWFSIRAKTVDYEKMFMGKDVVKRHLSVYRSGDEMISASKDNEYKALRLAEEMYERGIEIEPIDFNRVDPKAFTVVGDKIMPSLISIGRLGEKAAEQIITAAKDKAITSKEEFKHQTKCPQAVFEHMVHLGLLDYLRDSNQMSIFDYMNGQ